MLIAEMEKILNRKDAFVRYQQFRKKYRSEDYAGRFEFEAEDVNELKKDFEHYKHKLESMIPSKDLIKVYRSVRIPEYGTGETLDFLETLITKGVFKNKGKELSAGIYWSYSPKGSRVYWHDFGPVTKFIGVAPISSIDIEATLWLIIINPREMEIRLKPNAPLTIINIQTYYKGKDKDQIKSLIKNLKPIKVTACITATTQTKRGTARRMWTTKIRLKYKIEAITKKDAAYLFNEGRFP